MFENLDDAHPPQAGPETVAAVQSRSAELRRRDFLARGATAAFAVVALVALTAGVAAFASDDPGPADAAARVQESAAPGEPEVRTPPPSTTPPTTAPPTTEPTEVVPEQVEAPAPTRVGASPTPVGDAPAPSPPPAAGGYTGTVVVPDGWAVRVTVSGPGGSWSHPGLTNGGGFAQGNVAAGSYRLSWSAVSEPAPPGEDGVDIGTATRVGQQSFVVTSGQTATVTVYV